MSRTLTSLRHPVEKLLEAEHFLARMIAASGMEFQFELNAFLSASRSVTFVLQKAFANVPNFADWYEGQRAKMQKDCAMHFFLELRNFSQKQGPVSIVGGLQMNGGWTYRFIGQQRSVPSELVGRDVCACCAAHLTKLATLLAECARDFPFHSCPGRAFTETGMKELAYDWRDVEAWLGLPEGWTEVADIPAVEKFRILSREIEPLDVNTIQRIAAGDLRDNETPLEFAETSGTDLLDNFVSMMSPNSGYEGHPRAAFVAATMKRIKEHDGE